MNRAQAEHLSPADILRANYFRIFFVAPSYSTSKTKRRKGEKKGLN